MKHTLPVLAPVLALVLALVGADAVADPAPAPAKLLETDPPTAEISKMPKTADWSEGHPVELVRSPARCKATRLREWLRVVCHPLVTLGISLVSGDRKDVSFRTQESKGDEIDETKWSAEVVLPLRRGDRRVIQIAGVENLGYYGDSDDVRFVLSEHWLDDEAGPVVTID